MSSQAPKDPSKAPTKGPTKAPTRTGEASKVPTQLPGTSGSSSRASTMAPSRAQSRAPSSYPTRMQSQAPPNYISRAPTMAHMRTAVPSSGRSSAPPENLPTSSMRNSTKMPSAAPTSFARDGTRMPSVALTSLARDSTKMPSAAPTSLARDGTKMPSAALTSLARDSTKMPTAAPTSLARDGTKMPTAAPSNAGPSRMPSMYTTQKDKTMALRQSRFATLTPIEQKVNNEWAQDIIKDSNACPEGYGWKRVDGGYQCTHAKNGKDKAGGHGISDLLIAEGQGGCLSLPTQTWPLFDGIYYPDADNPKMFRREVGSENQVHKHAPGAMYVPRYKKH